MAEGQRVTVDYDKADGGSLWLLGFKNLILTLLTFGIYKFWAKTNTRRSLWARITLNGEPLEYTGRGIELFWGAILASLILFLAYVVFNFGIVGVAMAAPALAGVVAILLSITFGSFLLGYARYRANHYRFSRTNWRGIRGGQTGKAGAYAWFCVGQSWLSLLSLGFYYPYAQVKMTQRLYQELSFGSASFDMVGTARQLYRVFLVCLGLSFLVIFGPALLFAIQVGDPSLLHPGFLLSFAFAEMSGLTALGLALVWGFYYFYSFVFIMDHTTVNGAPFKFEASYLSYIWLVVSNLFIVILTLGIGAPVAQSRQFAFVLDRLSIEGGLPLEEIVQTAATRQADGEGLADSFGLGEVGI